MPATRRSTVWDYSDLRLRPDGTRVSSEPRASTSRLPRYPNGSAQDHRGNRVARDAAGKGTIPTYRIINTSNQESQHHTGGPGEKKTQESNLSSDSKDFASQGKGKQKEIRNELADAVRESEANLKGTSTVYERRAERRRRFREDASFITGRNQRTAPLPTADLLKCIHLFASDYYTVRGQLFDLSNEHRSWRKSSLKPEHESDVIHSELDPGDEGDSDPVDQENTGDRPDIDYIDDMYRMFEGSALMAMGMLVQEYLIKMLRVQPPADWSLEAGQGAEELVEGDATDDEDDSEDEDQDEAMDVDKGDARLSMLEGLIEMSEQESEGPVDMVEENDEIPQKIEEQDLSIS